MIYTPHIVVGATIGAKTQNLGLIIILGLLIHFLMDKVPHWDWDYTVVSNIKKFKKTRALKFLFPIFFKGAIDATIGILITFFLLWYKDFLSFDYLPFIVFGIFISLLPDATLGWTYLFGRKKFSKKYLAFHKKFLHSHCKKIEGKITFLGLMTEILVIIICVFLLSL